MRFLAAFFAAGVVAILICIGFVDQPVAVAVERLQGARILFQAMAAPSLLALPGATIVLVLAAFRRVPRAGIIVSAAVLAATAAKDELKWAFGRPWPETWLKWGDPTWKPFIDNVFYGSFPSGHTAYISAPMAVLWVVAPRWRPVWGGLVLSVMAGLVLADYHFVGDVIGGLLVGVGCAAGTMRVMRLPG